MWKVKEGEGLNLPYPPGRPEMKKPEKPEFPDGPEFVEESDVKPEPPRGRMIKESEDCGQGIDGYIDFGWKHIPYVLLCVGLLVAIFPWFCVVVVGLFHMVKDYYSWVLGI